MVFSMFSIAAVTVNLPAFLTLRLPNRSNSAVFLLLEENFTSRSSLIKLASS